MLVFSLNRKFWFELYPLSLQFNMLKKVYTHTGQRTGQFLKQTHIHFAVVTSSKNSVTVTCISFFFNKINSSPNSNTHNDFYDRHCSCIIYYRWFNRTEKFFFKKVRKFKKTTLNLIWWLEQRKQIWKTSNLRVFKIVLYIKSICALFSYILKINVSLVERGQCPVFGHLYIKKHTNGYLTKWIRRLFWWWY